MKTTTDSSMTSWYEVDELISMLRAWGIGYLVGREHPADFVSPTADQQKAVVLIQRLAQCDDYPRVRDATISLLLLHPELADAVQQALEESEAEVAESIAVLILATLYLQRLWSIRLAIALGHAPAFPEGRFASLWESRNLPPPACKNGARGLTALQEFEQRRTGFPFTFIGDWQNQVEHLLLQEEAKHHSLEDMSSLFALLEEAQRNENESELGQPNDDGAAIESFLQQLGRTFRKRVRLFSTTLGKMERGNNRDVADVKLLVEQGIINLDELDQAYQEVLAQLGKGRYPRITPRRFTERYQMVRGLI